MSTANAANNAFALAGTANPSVSSSGLGKAYLALQGISSLAGLVGGIAGVGSTSAEASRLNQQAELALEQSNLEAQQTANSVRSFRSSQASGYLNSGVLLEGSPLEVLANTVNKGNQEIELIQKQGQARQTLMRQQASQVGRSGWMNLLSSGIQAGSNMTTALIQGKRLGLLSSSKAGNSTALQPIPGYEDDDIGLRGY